jgi:hypothetical protein
VGQSTLVEEWIADGRRFVERFAADGNPVQVAFWGRTIEAGDWYLYVATDLYDRDGPLASYRAVQTSLSKLGDSAVSNSEIKVISPKNSIVREVLAAMSRHPGQSLVTNTTMQYWSDIDEEIIYPARVFTFTQANPMTSDEIARELVRLMNRGPGILQPSRVTLKDGTTFNGVPFALELGPQNAMMARFVADASVS